MSTFEAGLRAAARHLDGVAADFEQLAEQRAAEVVRSHPMTYNAARRSGAEAIALLRDKARLLRGQAKAVLGLEQR